MDSILKQETIFPFEIVINDDASKDSTSKIIKEYTEKYPTIFKTLIQTKNQRSRFKCGVGWTDILIIPERIENKSLFMKVMVTRLTPINWKKNWFFKDKSGLYWMFSYNKSIVELGSYWGWKE